MSINFRHLECFVTAADELHFSRAAKRLGVGQATVSEAVGALEAEFGRLLFDRTTRRVALTPFGMELLRDLRPALEDLRSVYLAAVHGATRQGKCVIVGHTPALGQLLLPHLAAESGEGNLPRWKPVLMHTHALIQAVVERRVDLGLCWIPQVRYPLVSRVLTQCPYVAILPSHDPLAGRSHITLSDLHGRQLAISSRSTNIFIYTRVLSAVLNAGLNVSAIEEVGSYEELAIFVATQGGVGLHPALIGNLIVPVPGVEYRRIAEESLNLDICVVGRNLDDPTIAPFVTVLHEHANTTFHALMTGFDGL